MSIENPNSPQGENKNEWSQIEKQVNEEEREKAKEKSSLKEKDIDFFISNLAVRENLKRFLREKPKENSSEKEEKESSKEVEKEKELSKEAEKPKSLSEELISLRWKNLVKSFREYKKKEDDIIFDEISLQQIIEQIKQEDKRAISTRNEVTDGLVDEVNSFKQEQEELKQSNPEAYVGLNLRGFKEQIERTRRGMLVETNYVKEKKEKTLKAMKSGDHMFLHGHLGGGKTDFAVDTSIDRMIDLNVNKEIKQWMEENPQADKKEITKKFREIEEKYEKGVEKTDPEIMEKVRPFIIAGSKDFDLQDLYTEKGLKVTKFNGEEVEKHNDNVEEELKKWHSKHEKELSQLNEEEKREREREAVERIRELYKMKHTGFGTEVEKIEKELQRAVKEGRPIIIDEANAIPPTLLISMNDILTKRPGEDAYVPGEGPVEVQEGFNIIMTGNLETSTLAEYFGTEEMNPAFLSRLNPQEYDYLPQNKDGNVHEQENPEENELFQAIVAFLANKGGSVELPKGAMDKLFKLAQLSKTTQDVFSGRWQESDMLQTESGDEAPEPKLEKSVLSIRNIINVLKEWNKGQEKDLDMALWEAFISNATVASDQNYILNEAKKYGFFAEKDGWNVQAFDGASLIRESDIRKRKYEYVRPENHTYSPRDTVQILYGQAPERVEFPDVKLEAYENPEIDPEKISEFEEFFATIPKYEKAYEKALGKEGCNESE